MKLRPSLPPPQVADAHALARLTDRVVDDDARTLLDRLLERKHRESGVPPANADARAAGRTRHVAIY